MPTPRSFAATLLFFTVLPYAARADGGAMPGVSFLDGILTQLSGPVARVITGLGIAFGAMVAFDAAVSTDGYHQLGVTLELSWMWY